MNSKDLLPPDWFELHDLLLEHSPAIFHDFLKIFGGGWFHYYEDATGIRMRVHWPNSSTGSFIQVYSIWSKDSAVCYDITRDSDPNDLTQSYRRFLKLKAFL